MEKKSTVDYVDMTEQTQMIVPKIPVILNNTNTDDFIQVCESYWKNNKELESYYQGCSMGTTTRSGIMFNEFLKRLKKAIEEVVRKELYKNGQTSESFKDDFKALESIFNIINNHLNTVNVSIKNEATLAFFHGFINSYVNSVLSTHQS